MSTFAELHQQWQTLQQDAQTTGSSHLAAQAEQLRQQLHSHPSTAQARSLNDRQDQARRGRH